LFVQVYEARTVPTLKFNELAIYECKHYVKLFYNLCDITH